jgi:hypothetical protein
MDAPVFDAAALAGLMSPPMPGYLGLIDRMRAGPPLANGAPGGSDATRHFGQFADRVQDLDDDELKELYEVSFVPADALALRHAAHQVRQHGCQACPYALPVLQRLLAPLEAARNPFAPLFKALCCVMLACRPAGADRAPVSLAADVCSQESS